MDDVTLIDLDHLGQPRTIGVYLVDGPGPALVDCGPASCLPRLESTLAAHGVAFEDLTDLLLTHVHLDHAGAAGALVARNPGLRVHVSELGARHLTEPERLERSARRVFGAEFDRLWGSVTPVPARNLDVVGTDAAGLECFATPGHAVHHTAFMTSDGTCFTGDVTGVRIAPSPYVAPATPPPDIDLEAYESSLAQIEARQPRRLCLSHFGIADDPGVHLERMREGLGRWSGWVRDGATESEFVAAATAELPGLEASVATALKAAAPFPPSFAGLKRYWTKRHASEGAHASPGGAART
jgi:glyoxylase-like metal-dependent hydrolase (beta-lactamase superfamily II)